MSCNGFLKRSGATVRILFLFFFFPFTNTAKHALTYFITVSPGVDAFPEFVATAKVDGVNVEFCQGDIRRPEPRQDWVKTLNQNDPEHMERHVSACVFQDKFFRPLTWDIRQHFNHTAGIHIFQEMFSCSLDDETGETHGFDRFGYDGEDFISLHLQNVTWMYSERAATYKDKWEEKLNELLYRNKITQRCPECLERFILYGKSFLERKVPPSVSLLQKSPSSPVSCHATGFYPGRAEMFWRKDGEELHEDVDKGEILPNHDGSFQMRVDLNISSVRPEDWSSYNCVFQLSGAEGRIITRLDKTKIRTNRVTPSEFPVAAAVVPAVLVGLTLLVASVSGLFLRRKSKKDFTPIQTSDTSLASDKDVTPE